MFNSWLEIGLVSGYLVVTYLKANKRARGPLWLIPMHICCGRFMGIQDSPLLFAQQIASLIFIIDAYRIARQTPTPENQSVLHWLFT